MNQQQSLCQSRKWIKSDRAANGEREAKFFQQLQLPQQQLTDNATAYQCCQNENTSGFYPY